MISLREIFLYIKPLWENRQGEVSVRAVLAIILTINFMCHITTASSDALFTEAGLIAALLGLTAFQNIQDKRTEADVRKTIIKTTGGKTDDSDDPDIQVNTVNIKK